MRVFAAIGLLGWLATVGGAAPPEPAANGEGERTANIWHGFRGAGNNVAASDNLPTEWSARGQNGVAWNVRLAGYGQSSPVVWNGAVYVTAIEGESKERLLVQSLDLATGERRWLQEFTGTQQVKDGDTVSRGAPTPAVDAEGVYALFESGDLIALAHDGREQWRRSLVGEYGKFEGPHGYASSLAQHEGRLVVQVSHRGPSYLLAIDKASGRNIWKSELPPQTAWSSPLVVAPAGKPMILIGTGGSLRALALEDGKEQWQVGDLQGITTPSPAWGDSLVVTGSSEPGFTQAFRVDAAGKLASAEPAWRAAKTTCGYASPLVHRGHVYFVNKTGVAVCHDLDTGEIRWTERLPGACWATPLAAGERIYFVTKDGTTAVVRAGPTYELLAENELSFTDVVYAVASADDSLLIRAGRSLVRIKGNPPPAAQ